jgi:crossover junction endodeoxyribonuclease RuvC
MKPTLRVLAIDPGYDRVGLAVVEKDGTKEKVIYSTCIETKRQDTFADRILTVGNSIEKALADYAPQCVAIETLFFNKNIKTAIGVAQARGVVMYLAKRAGCEIFEFGPQEIKIAITGYGKSDKTAVLAMVKRLVNNVPEHALDDEYDAIAVGVTCLAQYGQSR